ncbi:S-layer homology domain-containing protein [Aminipila butyrica]|uniref:S-layer homology domain-containing protein n=1 Tax=Aminipila butyrica TaxID=433296 RepID=A0A858BRP6_9FIRM|nr:S-layer homology domain-containing protein [Aminipila butyrica]QIB68573.1 S-layer homology domain-containing protein [Aminipila butyrica]
MKKIKGLILATVMATLLLTTVFSYAAVSFSDVKNTNWAYPYVSNLVERGSINGYSDGTFKPSNTITNAEFIKVLVATTVSQQEKTGTHWASGYMDKAVELGILKNNEITPAQYDQAISRELMATVIARTAEQVLKENIACEQRTVVAGTIYDYGSISDSYKDSVVDVYYAGIITGYSDGKFKPKNTATRAEACTMIIRLLEAKERKAYEEKESVKEVPIGTMIMNLEWSAALKNLTTCVIDDDLAKYEMEIYTNPINGVVGIKARYLYSTIYFIRDGEIVGSDGIMTDRDGYTSFGFFEGSKNGDITTIDYIGSLDNYTKILTLVANPFKK